MNNTYESFNNKRKALIDESFLYQPTNKVKLSTINETRTLFDECKIRNDAMNSNYLQIADDVKDMDTQWEKFK
jgi:hypothetical protein